MKNKFKISVVYKITVYFSLSMEVLRELQFFIMYLIPLRTPTEGKGLNPVLR